MYKKVILVAILALLVAAGCGGNKDRAGQEMTESPTMQGDGTTGDGTGQAERPDRGDVERRLMDAMNRMQTVYFDFDKYNLRDDAKRALENNADIMRENPELNVKIEGHCDERGTNEYNLALGEKRAKAARDYLTRLGIDAGRLSIISYGEERPVDPRHTEEAWSLNRRDEFVRN